MFAYGKKDAAARHRDALGLTREQAQDPDQVREAFRSAVRAAHPDNGGTGADVTGLKAARDALLRTAQKQDGGDQPPPPRDCQTCGGRGVVHHGFAAWSCPKCKHR